MSASVLSRAPRPGSNERPDLAPSRADRRQRTLHRLDLLEQAEWIEPAQDAAEPLREQATVLRRTLRGLPYSHLVALQAGLERRADDLVSGRLYRSARGGCPVGLLLAELDPGRLEGNRVGFALRHRWRRSSASYRGLARRHPRLRHLEWTFDHMIRQLVGLAPGLTPSQAAALVGRQFRDEALAELKRREASDGALS